MRQTSYSYCEDKDRKAIGILLVFYPQYYDNAVSRFNRILKKISPNDFRLIIVNNNPEELNCKQIDGKIIKGINRKSEFFGWDLGLRYANEEGLIDSNTVFVLANDTFAEHRFYFRLDEFLFVSESRKIREYSCPVMIGEINNMDNYYEIRGMRSQGWVSTYLFAFNYNLFNKLGSILLEEKKGEQSLYYIDKGYIYWSKNISINLQDHISKWLKLTWYNRQSLVNNDDRLKWKTYSILNEKYISALCCKYGGLLIDPYQKFKIINLASRILKRILKILSGFGNHKI
jgi:hypothetical protein